MSRMVRTDADLEGTEGTRRSRERQRGGVWRGAGRGDRGRVGGKPQVAEDAPDGFAFEDEGEDLAAAAARAEQHVDAEHPLHELGP